MENRHCLDVAWEFILFFADLSAASDSVTAMFSEPNDLNQARQFHKIKVAFLLNVASKIENKISGCLPDSRGMLAMMFVNHR